jgi:predicted dehydrogenase
MLLRRVRWGLLSTANINRRLIPAIRASSAGELTAVASRTLESAQTYAARWEIPLAFGSYQAMLASDQVDAVYISLPNHLHAEWAIRAMQAGKHVLCEKPLAISVDEVDRMAAASQQTGMRLAEAFMYRHHPQTKIARSLILAGRLGEVQSMWGVFNFSMGKREGNVRLVPAYGGGALYDVGVYPLSIAQYFFGSAPQRLAGFQWLGGSGVDEAFTGQMEYPGGQTAQIACSFRSPFYTQVEVIGSQGRLSLNRPFVDMENGRMLMLHAETGQVETIPVPEQELYLGQVEDMHAAILDGAPNLVTLTESRDHIRTVEALYLAARRAAVIDLP